MTIDAIAVVLCLVTVANGAPVMLNRLLGSRGALPLDFGLVLADGRPLLGKSKTIRGIVVAVLSTALVAPAIGVTMSDGALVGLLAMAGDLASSFTKRRLGLAPSSRATGLDQIPEALLPALHIAPTLSLSALDVFAVVMLFLGGNVALSPLLFRLGIRQKPY